MKKSNFLSNRIIREDMDDIYARYNFWERLNNKTVMVTGSYGMLASYFVYFLIYLNEVKGLNIKIISLSRNEDKFYKRFGVYAEREYLTNLTDDINKPFNIACEIDFIIHAASLADLQDCSTNPIGVALPNVLGTYNLLELANEKNVESFLFFSSIAIYGETSKNIVSEKDYGVIDPLDIFSSYSESKKMGETLLNCYLNQYCIPVKIVRFFCGIGPTLDLEHGNNALCDFCRNALNGQNIEIKSEGLAKRSYCYIADTTAAEFKVLLDGNNEAYNVCNTDEFISIRELAELIANIVDCNVISTHYDEKHIEPPRYSNYNNSKLRKLGWECKYSIENGFRRIIQSHLEK
ncbi:MAG: NAD(P)-dependent oxidoreductase [Endomicrobium sp.]|jgi:nucleoside-diphosphate-sugar epimerase|nr:NAD(P)-dependent oxidoreductase [Endomicrobium sp.]